MGKIAGANTKVTIGNSFTVTIPQGMTYAENIATNSGLTRLLTIIKTEKNSYYKEYSEWPFGIEEPFSAPQSFTLTNMVPIPPEVVLSAYGAIGCVDEVKTAKNESGLKIIYRCPVSGHNCYRFAITDDPFGNSSWGGQIFINDMPEGRGNEGAALSFLKGIEKVQKNKPVNKPSVPKPQSVPNPEKNKENDKQVDFEIACRKWSDEYKSIAKKRENEFRKRLHDEIQKRKDSLKSEAEAQIKKLQCATDKFEEQILSLNLELSQMGFFKFSEKSRLKNEIAELNNKISETKIRIDHLEHELETNLENVEKKIDKKKLKQEVNQAVPLPETPRVPPSMNHIHSNNTSGNNTDAKRILMFLAKNGGCTVSEIMRSLGIESNYHASSLVRKLKEGGEIYREEIRGVAYFYCYDKGNHELAKFIAENPGITVFEIMALTSKKYGDVVSGLNKLLDLGFIHYKEIKGLKCFECELEKVPEKVSEEY